MPLEEQLKITASMGLNVLEVGITNAPIVSKSYNRKKNNTMNKPKVIFLPHAIYSIHSLPLRDVSG